MIEHATPVDMLIITNFPDHAQCACCVWRNRLEIWRSKCSTKTYKEISWIFFSMELINRNGRFHLKIVSLNPFVVKVKKKKHFILKKVSFWWSKYPLLVIQNICKALETLDGYPNSSSKHNYEPKFEKKVKAVASCFTWNVKKDIFRYVILQK